MPRYIAIVGGKHSGKTTLTQQLVRTLKNRGYHVATIKEMPNTQTIDPPAASHDTSKHTEAGADIVVASPKNETVLFINKKLGLNEIAPYLCGMDFVVLEGFENETVLPKIIAAKTAQEAASFSDGLAIAISGIIAGSAHETQAVSRLKISVLHGKTQLGVLADLVEQKAFTLLPNLTECAKCHPTGQCGYLNCYEYAKAIVADKTAERCCPLDKKEELVVEVNGVRLPLKDFPARFVEEALVGMFGSLHGGKDIKSLRVELRRVSKGSH
ncbi:MAG: molybdopterin-guanine dinucleotide biosynthesis protein B [Candidatus Bathyarchaeota archaeon]|nr:molybdopterin-guanine dinucleotide biosynthesis protein B [Candidatus Bathyarchaeota archaeon]